MHPRKSRRTPDGRRLGKDVTMKVMKKILALVAVVLCLAVVGFFGSFLLRAIPQKHEQPVLQTDQIFDPIEKAEPGEEPAEEPAPEDPPIEEEPEEPDPSPEEPAQEPEETTPEPGSAEEKAKAYLQTMTLEEKIWQMFLVTPDALTGKSPVQRAGEQTAAALAEKPVGGLIYFSSNLTDRQQVIDMLSATQSYAKTPLFLGVDEEGGVVSRLGTLEGSGVTHFSPAADYGAAGDTGAVYDVGSTLASQLGELGFNLDFAPVADIVTNPNNTEIGSRAYSDDPNVAAPMVASMVQGLQDGGMLSCLKHFPGHGSTEADSHQGTSVSTRTVEELRQTEWVTFQAGIDAGVQFVMISHLTNENLSSLPCSLSEEVMTALRQELGYEGIIITDSLQMGAIVDNYTSAQAAVLAVCAGADMLLMPNDMNVAFEAIVAAMDEGFITESRIDESVMRILTAKYQFGIME